MTATVFNLAVPARTAAASLTWPGRILSGVVGGFLALDALSRLVWFRALVAPSEGAPTLEPSLQVLMGAPLALGVVLYLWRPARLYGAALLLVCLAGFIAVEAAADVRSPSHMLFWGYVAALVIAGLALRRSPPSRQ
ncbi:MAG TPA: hypothetical protein VFF66_01030 [Brevundimonas sp.]|nr:hypothetical protein [Brevundimonas sp.]